MQLKGAIHALEPGAVITLFVLDLSRFGENPVRFHAGTNEIGGDVVWAGQVYQRYPVQTSGFEWKGEGTLPRPRLVVSNVTGIISALCRLYGDLVGCMVTRQRTLVRYLDAVNFDPPVNPAADPEEAFPDDVYFVNRKARETKDLVEFELAVIFDVEGVRLPRRQVIANACPWQYRRDGCGYAGPPVATAADAPTSDPDQDRCGKRLASCKLRFGDGVLPFGGYPGVGTVR